MSLLLNNFGQIALNFFLEDIIQGMYDEEDIMEKLAEAYGYNELRKGNINEDTKG